MMEHPFVNNLSDKSLEDLQTDISSLTGKLNFAYRMSNQALVQQLQMAINSYRSEYGRKMDTMMAKQNMKEQISIQKDS